MKTHFLIIIVSLLIFSESVSAQIRYKELQRAQDKLWKQDSANKRIDLDKNSVTVFSDDGYKFTLFLNNKKQNSKPADEVKVEKLNNPYYDARVEFQDAKYPPLSKKIRVVTPQGANADVIYKIKYDDDGNLILFFLCDVPVKKDALTYESGRKIMDISGGRPKDDQLYDYYDDKGTGNAGGSSTVVTTVQTTVAHNSKTQNSSSAVAGNSGNGNMNVNTNSMNTESGTSAYVPNSAVANTLTSGIDKEHINNNMVDADAVNQSPSFSGTRVTRNVQTIKDTLHPGYYYSLSDSNTRLQETVNFQDDGPAQALEKEKIRTDVSDNDVAHFRCEPMSDSAYNVLVATIPTKGNDDDKLLAAEKGIESASSCLSSEQILNICQMMTKDKSRLEFGEYAYPKVADPYNYPVVAGSMFSVKEQMKLQKYIAKMNGK